MKSLSCGYHAFIFLNNEKICHREENVTNTDFERQFGSVLNK